MVAERQTPYPVRQMNRVARTLLVLSFCGSSCRTAQIWLSSVIVVHDTHYTSGMM